MLRYIARGPRNFTTNPVPPSERMNWEFYAITEGNAAPYFLTGRSPSLRSRILWLLPPQVRYGWRGDGRNCQRLAFHFSSVPNEVCAAIGDRPYLTVPLVPEEIKSLHALAGELESHWKSPHQYSHLVCERALLELALIILKQQPLHKEVPLDHLVAERVERAIGWYYANMTKNPSVNEVAAIIHVSPVHLRRLFYQSRGQSPHAVFREMQIKRAKELLATTQWGLESIRQECGFHSVTDFARVFRKEVKSTPDSWRKWILLTKGSASQASKENGLAV